MPGASLNTQPLVLGETQLPVHAYWFCLPRSASRRAGHFACIREKLPKFLGW
jgi:hypothetical protein